MLTAAIENNIEVGDIVLYKDFTEAQWQVGIYAGYNKDASRKSKHNIIVYVYPDDEGNPDIEKFMILPFRYALKCNIKKLDVKNNC